MAGLLDFLGFGQAGGPSVVTQGGQPTGLLGGLSRNSDSLLGFGMGMLGGENQAAGFQNALSGMQRGELLDGTRAKTAKAEMEMLAKKKAYAEWAATNPMAAKYAPLIAANPELGDKLVEAQATRNPLDDKYKQAQIAHLNRGPDPSFAEKLYGNMSPDEQAAYRRSQAGIATNTTAQREADAQRLGMKPGDPAYQSFVLTGKMPREDAQPLTATDKKFIMEADEGVSAAQNAIDNLNKAKKLSPGAYAGPLAAQRGYVTSQFGNKTGEDTENLDNIVKSNALSSLKSIFGGNPTEGERGILLEIQGSSSKSDVVRQDIYDRAIALAQKRLEMNKQRANELRGGQFYKSGGGVTADGAGKAAAPANPLSAADAIVGIGR